MPPVSLLCAYTDGSPHAAETGFDRSAAPKLAPADAGADLHSMSAGGAGVRIGSSSWRADNRALGGAISPLGLSAIPARGQLQAAAGRWQSWDGCAAPASHLPRPLPLHTQPNVSRASDLPLRPRADVLVLVRADHPQWPRDLVSSACAARRSTARRNFWRRIRRLSSAGEAMDFGASLILVAMRGVLPCAGSHFL